MSQRTIDDIYAEAEAMTGKTRHQLRSLAIQSFASALVKLMADPARPIWSVAAFDQTSSLTVEVDVPRRTPR